MAISSRVFLLYEMLLSVVKFYSLRIVYVRNTPAFNERLFNRKINFWHIMG